jgi:hypothetical protein
MALRPAQETKTDIAVTAKQHRKVLFFILQTALKQSIDVFRI